MPDSVADAACAIIDRGCIMKNSVFSRWIFVTILMSVLLAVSGCAKSGQTEESSSGGTTGRGAEEAAFYDTGSETAAIASSMDYLILVNKNHAIPRGWENVVDEVSITNSQGDEILVERTAYAAYLKLHDQLAREGIMVDISSAWRSDADQEALADTAAEGKTTVSSEEYVAEPGQSEHQTGLALDLYLNIDGKDVVEKKDLEKYPEIWEEIHDQLPEFGFILRFPKGSEGVTGHPYEPWHIRYVGEKAAAEITQQEITLEEYLDEDDL